MATNIYAVDRWLKLEGYSQTATEVSWTTITDNSLVGFNVDQNDDGNLDTSTDYWYGTGQPYSGFTVEIGGKQYAIFTNGGKSTGYISYNSADVDLSAFIPTLENSSTTTLNENGTAANFCFWAGTQISTPTGACNVEELRIGDLIRTADGRDVPVKWLGRQTVSTPVNLLHHARRAPVIISKGALGNGLPKSDLTVSADHGMILDGFVINASALVDGKTIRFVPEAELPAEFTYYHIETEDHDVILANGAASETFIDAAGRAAFDNHNEYLDLYGAERVVMEMSLTRIVSARLLPPHLKSRLGRNEQDAEQMSAA